MKMGLAQARAKRFSLELNNWSTKSASTRTVRAKRCETNISEKAGSSWRTRIIVAFSSRMISQSVIAVAVAKRNGCPVRHPSPQNSSGPSTRDDGFLALL